MNTRTTELIEKLRTLQKGLTTNLIAEAAGVSTGTVTDRIHRHEDELEMWSTRPIVVSQDSMIALLEKHGAEIFDKMMIPAQDAAALFPPHIETQRIVNAVTVEVSRLFDDFEERIIARLASRDQRTETA